MADMFNRPFIPNNIVFESEFFKLMHRTSNENVNFEHIDNTISKEVNDDKPTQESTRPKSKAIENKTINREIAAEAGLLDKGNLMTKVNQ
jgi:hypothetical protein